MNAFYFVTDENHAPVAGAQALNIAGLWNCDVHIFVERRDPSRPLFEVASPHIFYHYEELGPFMPPGLPVDPRWPAIIYLRLFAPALLEGYNRLIYIDTDVHIVGADQRLWDVPLSAGLGMVEDFGTRMKRQDHLPKIGVRSGRYANSGVMLIDRERWITNDFRSALPGFFDTFPAASFYDQDFINHHFDGIWSDLSPRFNFQNIIFNLGYTDQVAPVFLHFCSSYKPWYGTPPDWFSSTPSRFTAEYDDIFRAAGLPDPLIRTLRRRMQVKVSRRIRFGLRRWLSHRNVSGGRERRELANWRARSDDFQEFFNSCVDSGRFADAPLARLEVTGCVPVFDGRFVRPMEGGAA